MQSNLFQTNTFIGGLDLDTDINFLQNDRYRYAENVRVTTDNLGTTGVLQNIQSAKEIETNDSFQTNERILYCTTCNKYIIVLTVDSNGVNVVYRIDDYQNPPLKLNRVLRGYLGYDEDSHVKIVCNYESEDRLYIYISGIGKQIRSFNVMSDKYNPSSAGSNPLVDEYGNIKEVGVLDIVPDAILTSPQFIQLVSGGLMTGAVQYAYQLFNKNGNQSSISPISELIYLTSSREVQPAESGKVRYADYEGSDSDENSGKGVQFLVDFTSDQQFVNYNFDSIRIYRIFYKSNTDEPVIDIISEHGISDSMDRFTFTDTGQTLGVTYTVEEFNQMLTLFSCSTIQNFKNILFAANTQDQTFDVEYDARAYRCDSKGFLVLQDSNSSRSISQQLPSDTEALNAFYAGIPEDHDCINPYNQLQNQGTFTPTDGVDNMQYGILDNGVRKLGGQGLNVSYRFTYYPVILDTNDLSSEGSYSLTLNSLSLKSNNSTKQSKYLDDDSLTDTITELDKVLQENFSNKSYISSYANPLFSTYLKGYMRDEIYRFGIVFYNEKNQASPVHWIGDIRMPWAGEHAAFYHQSTYLEGRALGIEFDIRNIPEGVTRWEIVRCDRTEADRTVVMQAMISSVINDNTTNRFDHIPGWAVGENTAYPRIPLGYCKSGDYYYISGHSGPFDSSAWTTNDVSLLRPKDIDDTLALYISPEIDIDSNQVRNQINNCFVEELYTASPLAKEMKWNTTGLYSHPVDIKVKYFCTPNNTVKAMTTERVEFPSYCWTVPSENNHSYASDRSVIVNSDYPSHSDVYGISAYEAKRYVLTHPFATIGERTQVQQNSNLTSANLLKQADISSPQQYYQSAAGKNYLNVGLMSTWADGDPSQGTGETGSGSGQTDGPTNALAYFGSCLIGGLNTKQDASPWAKDQLQLDDNTKCFYNNDVRNTIDGFNFNPFNTTIVNFKKAVTPYGGNTYFSRQSSTYISTHCEGEGSQKAIAYGGDIYLGVHDHKTCYPIPDQQSDEVLDTDTDRNAISGVDLIPFESTVAIHLLFGQNTVKSVENDTDYMDVYLANTIEGGTVSNVHAQSKPYYVYNDVYSLTESAKLFVSIDDNTELNQYNSNRIRYSLTKTFDEVTDSWTRFQQANYMDVDQKYGAITNLISSITRLYYFQEDAIGIASVNERSLITDNNQTELVLGTGSILSRFDYITAQNGSNKINDPSILTVNNTTYWYDDGKNELARIQDTAVEKISKTKQVQSMLNELVDFYVHDASYDPKFNEVSMAFNDRVLVFNEVLDRYTSFYTYNPDFHATFADKTIYIKDNKFEEIVPYSDNKMTCKIQFIINKDVLYTKVFDNVFFGGVFDDIYYSLQEVKFNTKSQTASILKNYLDNSKYAIDYREDTYRFAIGREDEAIDSMSYPGRLKGKYLICNYTIKCDDQHNFNLPAINTTYRRSLV